MKRTKQALALLLCLLMGLSLFPTVAFAEESQVAENEILRSVQDDGEPVIEAVSAPEAVVDDASNASGSVVASGDCGMSGSNVSSSVTWTLYSDGE